MPPTPCILKKRRIISVIKKDESLQSLVLLLFLSVCFYSPFMEAGVNTWILRSSNRFTKGEKIRLYLQTERQTWLRLLPATGVDVWLHRAGFLGQLSPPCAYLPRSNLLLGLLGRIRVRSVTHTWSKVTMPHNSAVSRTSCLARDFVEI